jgi:hypothetical protein
VLGLASCTQAPDPDSNAADVPQAQAAAAAPEEAAPAVGTPFAGHGDNLNGVWTNDPPPDTRAYQNSAFGPEPPAMTPWAQERYDKAKPTFGPKGVPVADTNDPVYQCFPPGTPRIYFHPFPMEIIETPGRVLMVFEYDHLIRQIWTDGRGHRDDLAPSWMGDSIGHWEGDTLVVETTNFNDKTWIDREGTPHSEELRVLERIHRTDKDHLQIDITMEDPVAFPAPWTGHRYYARSEWNIEEFMCIDNINFETFENDLLNYGQDNTGDGGDNTPQ